MTAIVGVRLDDGRVLLGADSALTEGGTVTHARVKKLFRRGRAGFGCAGDFIALDRVYSNLRLPSYVSGDPEAWVRKVAVPGFRNILGSKMWPTLDALVAVGGQLFFLGVEGVHGFHDGYAAIGSGAQVAMGALYATRDPHVALRAAERHCNGVRGPFRTIIV